MCGGAIRIVTCSRVAVRAAQQALRVTNDRDFRHLVELSFTDELRSVVYRQAGVDSAMSSDESDSVMIRRNYLRRQHAELECFPFSWYLANVVMSDVVRPSTDAQHFGKLRSASSGLCLGADSEESVRLVTCHEHLYERELVVEMTTRGAIVRGGGQCLEPTDATVAFAPCETDSPRQRWWMSDGRLSPVTVPRLCLTESTGHEDRPHRLAVLKDCTNADGRDSLLTQHWNFVNF